MSNLVYYSQEDRRWKDIMYSITGDKTQTIGTSACGPTCAAMAISSLTATTMLPTSAANYAINKGYRTANSGTSWDFFKSITNANNLECKQTASLNEVKEALKCGKLVIASMGKGNFTSGGHYILMVGINAKNGVDWIDVYDPNHDNTKYGTDGKINQGVKNDGKVSALSSVFASQAKQYWIVYKEREEMTPEEKVTFDKLAERVGQLEKASELITAPAWFIKEFASADLNGKISNPKLTAEGWRTLAIGLRVSKK